MFLGQQKDHASSPAEKSAFWRPIYFFVKKMPYKSVGSLCEPCSLLLT